MGVMEERTGGRNAERVKESGSGKNIESVRVSWSGSAKDKGSSYDVVSMLVDKRLWFTTCKNALQLDECHSVQAEIKSCEL